MASQRHKLVAQISKDWQVLRRRTLNWIELPPRTIKNVLRYLTAKDMVKLDTSMTNCKARELLLECYKGLDSPSLKYNPRVYKGEGNVVLYGPLHQSLLWVMKRKIDLKDKDGKTPLANAILQNRTEIVMSLLNIGVDPEIPDDDGKTPLVWAVLHNRVEVVKALIAAGVDMNQSDINGVNVLMLAAAKAPSLPPRCPPTEPKVPSLRKGRPPRSDRKLKMIRTGNAEVEMVKVLLEAGVDKDKTDNEGKTPLVHATRKAHVNVLKTLLVAGVDANKADNDGKTPMIWAILHGRVDIVKALLEANVDKDKADNLGMTPLMSAIELCTTAGTIMYQSQGGGSNKLSPLWRSKNLDLKVRQSLKKISEILLRAGADMDKAANNGLTPLTCAAKYGSVGIVETLLIAGADKERPGLDGFTPLICASLAGQLHTVNTLIAARVEVERACDGHTALMCAAKVGSGDMVRALLAAGANVNRENNAGITPLLIAAGEGHADVACALLKAGADKEKTLKDGYSPILIASNGGHYETVQVLCAAGAEKDKPDDEGITPLLHAIINGHALVVESLLAWGADKDMACKEGYTPLMEAAKRGEAEIIKLLLSYRADLERETNGYTALKLAAAEDIPRTGYDILLIEGQRLKAADAKANNLK